MICNNCGNQIEDGVGFCRFCGSSTVAPSQPTMERAAAGEYAAVTPDMGGASYQNMPKKKKNLKWLIPVIAVVVVIGVLAAIFIPKLVSGKKHSSPKAVMEGFIKYAKKGDIDKMIECYHPSLQGYLKADAEESEMMLGIYQSISMKVTDVEYYDADEVEECNEEYGTHFEAGAEVTFEVSMMGFSNESSMTTVKDDGKWYIYDFEIAEEIVEDRYDDYYDDFDLDFDF